MTSAPGHLIHATGEEIEVGYRPEVPIAIAVAAGLLALLCTGVALATSGVVSGVSWVLAVLFVTVLVGALGTLRRRPRVLLTATGLTYRGWAVDASVAWEDVEGTATDKRFEWRPVAEVLVRPDAGSFRRETALLALPEPMGRRPVIRILARGLDEPWLLVEYVDQLARLPAHERPGRLGAAGLAFLDGSSAHPQPG